MGTVFDQRREMARRLYDAHGKSLFRYAAMLLTDRAAAEDVIQDVFAAIVRQEQQISDELNYLRRAVRNRCYSSLRQRLRRTRRDEHLLAAGDAHRDIEPEVRLALEDGLRSLPIEQREALHLHVYEGMTFKEIATLLDMSPNTAAGRYRYALERLRLHLDAPANARTRPAAGTLRRTQEDQ